MATEILSAAPDTPPPTAGTEPDAPANLTADVTIIARGRRRRLRLR
jgi:hypothetical protein